MRNSRPSFVASIVLFLLAFVGIVASVRAQQGGVAPAQEARIWTGVYSDAQAQRGQKAYQGYCLRCHAADLTGGARGRGGPPLKDDRFWLDFENQPLSNLFSKIQRTMPQDAPGTLREEDYLDVLAHILAQNGFPAGSPELVAAGLNAIPIVQKPGTVRELPNFSTVRVVGCFAKSGENGWLLTNATAPAATRDERTTPESLAAARALEAGTQTYRLLDVGHRSPATQVGQRLEVRGILDRTTDQRRIDVLSMGSTGSACAP